MEKSFRKRIRNIENHLKFFLSKNEYYYLGIPYEEYQKSNLLSKYNLPEVFPSQKYSVQPSPKGSVTKSNINGKYTRQKPEVFEIIMRRIDYIRKKDRKRVIYDREYRVYKKILLHKYNAKFYFVVNQHGEKLIVSEKLKYDELDSVKSIHIANMFNEIFNFFEIYDKDLNPAINFNTKFDQLILPSGTLDDNNFDELIEINKRFIKDEVKQKAFQKRLQLIKTYKPDIRGKGPSGFLGYLVFGFPDIDIVILENMYYGNATYVFTNKNFEKNMMNDKQTVLNNKLYEKRFFHNENWEKSISIYLKKLGKNPT